MKLLVSDKSKMKSKKGQSPEEGQEKVKIN